MLRECQEHGYFRGEKCPVCEAEGKFLMSDREVEHIGRSMAGVLRHFPKRFDLDMDEKGWVDVRAFISAMIERQPRLHWLRMHHIVAIVETDPKGRYQLSNGKMRATYGHSFEVELDLPTDNIPELLYYPATEEEAPILLENGLKPADRRMVHLSKTSADAYNAGRVRTDKPTIIEIEASMMVKENVPIQRAGKTVFITKEVPAKYLRRMSDEEIVVPDDSESPDNENE
ncbi:MAG: RNA 2'-phosphotransferase [Thermoplasmata archaeon]|nr:RNA 2'-phosphotransferase [Candidatus Sysuiplasma acidicola]MBX8637350.1 RNA 2'-phosphotransferase [Candidatus Sysuiplasma acidicola]MBX8645808.1 RNA 2'-phosphotransferase [Candidatus Sysuiplasma acidicola]MDH2906111.1 RNA 2'-phosphotransferase [Methanomassiliicoccales archaeon]